MGNGQNINIRRDNWIRHDGALKITGMKKWSRIKKVKDLLGTGPNEWNDHLLNRCSSQMMPKKF
jgi:hypothetical protein